MYFCRVKNEIHCHNSIVNWNIGFELVEISFTHVIVITVGQDNILNVQVCYAKGKISGLWYIVSYFPLY